jgi:transposase-like protein
MECGSSAVSERSERTVQGYRRFRCRTCGKQFNERSAGLLNRTHYPYNRIEQDHRGIKGRYQPMRGFKSNSSAARFCRSFD